MFLLAPPKLLFSGVIFNNSFVSRRSSRFGSWKSGQSPCRRYEWPFLVLDRLLVKLCRFPLTSKQSKTKNQYRSSSSKEMETDGRERGFFDSSYRRERDCRGCGWTWGRCHSSSIWALQNEDGPILMLCGPPSFSLDRLSLTSAQFLLSATPMKHCHVSNFTNTRHIRFSLSL